MNNKKININEVVLENYSHGDSKVLHIYSVTAYLTAGYGYVSIEDYIKQVVSFCKISSKTAKRWVTKLKQNKLIKIKKGIMYIKGRKALEEGHDTSRTYIKFYEKDLKSYSNFQKHTIRQLALLTQRRMSFHIRKSKVEDPTSLVNSGIVETELAVVRSAKKAGCSISQLTKKLGFDKMTISRALKGHTEKQFGTSLSIKGGVVRKKYKSLLNQMTGVNSSKCRKDHRWSFEYNSKNDTYKLKYALASRILVESNLCKK